MQSPAPFLNSVTIGAQGQRTLAGSAYVDLAIFAQEMKKIFQNQWICVGLSNELPDPGSYRLRSVGSESLILLRDHDGNFRGHFNVCRHRGTRLCNVPQGKLTHTLQCPYHAWTYALDGRLMGVPDEHEIIDFCRDQHALHSFSCQEWHGMLWINLASSPIPFQDYFAPLVDKFSAWQIDKLATASTITYDVRANWKLIAENYSECYHCAPVHPNLSRLSPPKSGGNDLISGPFLGGFMDLVADVQSLSLDGRSCGFPVGPLTLDDQRRVYYYLLFPNTFLSLHQDYVMLHTLWPQSPERTVVECSWLFHPSSLEPGPCEPQKGIQLWDQTNREDWNICEQTQLGVSSSRYTPGPYSNRESMAAAFDRHYLSVFNR
jgi:Rieske 2Fe-2S family protein